jgi:hypothetical protein
VFAATPDRSGHPGRPTTGRAGTDIATGDRARWNLASSRADDFVGRARHTKTEYPCPALPGTSAPPPLRRRGRHVLERGSIILLGSQYLPARRVHLGQCGTDGLESDQPVRFEPCIMVAPGAEFSRPGAESVAGSAPSQVTVSRRGCPGGTAVIAASISCEVVSGGVRPGAALARHRGQPPVVLSQ